MKKKLSIALIISICTIFSLVFMNKANAQVQNTDITLIISPEFPAPNQTVNATLTSYVVDLNKTNISWYLNQGDPVMGIGKKSFSFTAGNIGEELIIDVTIDTVTGQTIRKSFTIIPTEVDMLWEAENSFVPPFYRGKALVSTEGTYKIVAIPNITILKNKIKSENLSYYWQKENRGQDKASGWGKNYFTFKNTYLDNKHEIKVIATDISNSISSQGTLKLTPVNPKILFYEKDEVLGVKKEKTLKNGFILDKDKTTVIVAIPYFFSTKNIMSDDLKFEWVLGGKSINSQVIKNEIGIRVEKDQRGSSLVELFVSNLKTMFQESRSNVLINF